MNEESSGAARSWEPVRVPVSEDARPFWEEFYNETEERLGNEEPESALRSPISKSRNIVLRLALILHQIRVASGECTADAIDGETMLRVIAVARWYRDEALRVWARFSETEADAEARLAVEWIRTHGGRTTAREMQRCGPKAFRVAEKAKAILDDLVTRGCGVWERTQRGPKGGQPADVFCLREDAHRKATRDD
jgi:hypothetical protein